MNQKEPNVTNASSRYFRKTSCRRCGLTVYSDQRELRPLCARCGTIEARGGTRGKS